LGFCILDPSEKVIPYKCMKGGGGMGEGKFCVVFHNCTHGPLLNLIATIEGVLYLLEKLFVYLLVG